MLARWPVETANLAAIGLSTVKMNLFDLPAKALANPDSYWKGGYRPSLLATSPRAHFGLKSRKCGTRSVPLVVYSGMQQTTGLRVIIYHSCRVPEVANSAGRGEAPVIRVHIVCW